MPLGQQNLVLVGARLRLAALPLAGLRPLREPRVGLPPFPQ